MVTYLNKRLIERIRQSAKRRKKFELPIGGVPASQQEAALLADEAAPQQRLVSIKPIEVQPSGATQEAAAAAAAAAIGKQASRKDCANEPRTSPIDQANAALASRTDKRLAFVSSGAVARCWPSATVLYSLAICVCLQVACGASASNFELPPTGLMRLQLRPSLGKQVTQTNRNDRWANVGQTYETRDQLKFGQRQSQLARAINRIRRRIGARNSIRIHNAFRDFAWQILARLSMPTPVIYELRRQNFYPPEEDSMNDSLHNKNTTKTIRTRRLLGASKLPAATKRELARREQRLGRAAIDSEFGADADDADQPNR